MRIRFVWCLTILAGAALLAATGCGKKEEERAQPGTEQRAEPKKEKRVEPKTEKPAEAKTAEPVPAAEPVAPSEGKLSYALGVRIGNTLAAAGAKPDSISPEALAQGVDDALASRSLAMPEEERTAITTRFQQERARKAEEASQERMQEKLAEKKRWEEQAAKNLEEGARFLAENKKKEGVVELPSGLQYKVIREGTGASPSATDTVKCHYRGTYLDGKEFDNSYTRGQPLVRKSNELIAGWTEALQLMKAGAKWELYIPYSLAYGKGQPGGDMPPNSTLIFEMELLEVVK